MFVFLSFIVFCLAYGENCRKYNPAQYISEEEVMEAAYLFLKMPYVCLSYIRCPWIDFIFKFQRRLESLFFVMWFLFNFLWIIRYFFQSIWSNSSLQCFSCPRDKSRLTWTSFHWSVIKFKISVARSTILCVWNDC